MNVDNQGTVRLACCNHKGGVGKTTCAVNLAAGLARRGWRVLAVDADPQAHLTASLGLSPSDTAGLAEILCDGLPLATALVDTETGLSILPGSGRLAAAEGRIAAEHLTETLLAETLDRAVGFNAVVIDCPPHLGPITRQALIAATDIMVPMTPDFLAMQSLAWLMETLEGLSDKTARGPAVLGILLNRFSAQKRLHREVQTAVDAHFPTVALTTVIRENVALAEAPSHGLDIFQYAPKSAGAQDFAALCREVAIRLGREAGTHDREPQ